MESHIRGLAASRRDFMLSSVALAGALALPAGLLSVAQAVAAGQISFTIDQSPYLQGFLPTLYLYLWQLSGGLVSPPTTDTGLKFVTKANVAPYTSPASRFEGSTTAQKYFPHTGPITV